MYIQVGNNSNNYTQLLCTVHAQEWTHIVAQSPCFCFSLFPFPFASLYLLGTLLAVIGSRPPWSQVARKLISPFPSSPHSLPIPKSRPPGVFPTKCAPSKTTSQNWLTSPEQESLLLYEMFHHCFAKCVSSTPLDYCDLFCIRHNRDYRLCKICSDNCEIAVIASVKKVVIIAITTSNSKR